MDDKEPDKPKPVGTGFKVDPRFINLRPLGHGGNSIVYAATDSDCDKEVAIKKLSFCDTRGCKYVIREIRLMHRLQHENIITVYEVLGSNGFSLERGGEVTCNLNEMSCVYIVQELLHTDLHQVIQQDQLTADHIKLFTYQLLRGLKYIHSANVLHRDLKPLNLLINVEDLVLKIADFGMARVLDTDYSHKGFLTDNVGTCWYRSPELIISPRDYSKAIDMWSVGCILAEMISGRPLFTGAHEMDQIGQILDTICLSDNEWNRVTQILPQNFIRKHNRTPIKPLADRFTNIDIDALDLLEKLLVFDPSLRMSAEEALSHPYLHQYSCVEDEPIVLEAFHVEHEVDELSPKSSRKLISSEMSKSVESCGTQQDRRNLTTNVQHSRENQVNRTAAATFRCNNQSSSANQTNTSRNSSRSNNKLSNETIEIVEPLSDLIEDYVNDNTHVRDSRRSSNKPNIQTAGDSAHDNRKGYSLEELDDLSGNHSREIIDLLPLHLIQVPSLENQLKQQLQIVVDVPDEENSKELLSPKENKDEGTEKFVEEQDKADAEKFVVTVDAVQPRKKLISQREKDILNEEKRAESPKENMEIEKVERIDFIRVEKEKLRNNNHQDKMKNSKREKKKKKNRRNNHRNGDESQDYDSLYRLPTEHLTRHRNGLSGKDRNLRSVEEQLRLHEEINERRKMAELEKEMFGAVGGFQIELDENSAIGRSRNNGAGNISPSSEHSRDSSPSNEESNVLRRFER